MGTIIFFAVVIIVCGFIIWKQGSHLSGRGVNVPRIIPIKPLDPRTDLSRVPADRAYELCTMMTFQTGKPHMAHQNPDGTFRIEELKTEA